MKRFVSGISWHSCVYNRCKDLCQDASGHKFLQCGGDVVQICVLCLKNIK